MLLATLTTTLTLASTLAVLWIARYSLDIRRKKKSYANVPGPKPVGLKGFFLGNLPDIVENDHKGLTFTFYMATLIKDFGNTFKVRILHHMIVYTIDPKIVKEIFIDENFKKPVRNYTIIGYPGSERYLGHGLVSEMDHEKWKHDRALFNPGFQRQVLMTFMNEFNSKADILINFLRKKADGKTEIVLLDQFNRTALDIIASVAFSMKLDSVNNPENKFNEYIFQSLSGIKYYFTDPFIKLKPHKWPLIMRHRKAIRYLRDTGRKQIIERIEMIKKNEELPNDILTTIFKTHENEEFDLESMVDHFVTFFIAGQETTATLLSSLFLELGRNEQCLEKLRSEIDEVIGDKIEITFDDIHKLKYTSCCIKETLRLWPPVNQLTRFSHKDVHTDGFIIPKGTIFMTSIMASSRCEEYFKDPLIFNPDRFNKAENGSVTQNVISNYVYYPFSLGPRNCIGQNFAQIEAKVLIAKFIQNFDFKLNPNQSFAPLQAGTLRPKDGTKTFLTLRN